MAFADTVEEQERIRAEALAIVDGLLNRVPYLRDSTDLVLKTMHRIRRKLPSEAVNWADLSCVEAGVKVSSDNIRLFVLIEEVSPDAYKFAIEVQRRLERDYRLPGVEVDTAW